MEAGTGTAAGSTVPVGNARAVLLVAPTLSGDDALVAFLRSVELAGTRLYAAAVPFVVTPAGRAALTAFASHHAVHAAGLATVGGGTAVRANAALLANLSASMQTVRTEGDELSLLYSFEEQMAATYQWVAGRLVAPSVLGEAATILPVEAGHAVVLGTLLGKPMDGLIPPFQSDTGYLNPDNFPVG